MLTRTAHRLAIEAITVTYNNGHTALTDASFQLTGGTICALVGVNGSGKSTLFKSIMGMVKPVTGRVALDDLPIRTALKQNLVAYVPQSEDVDWNFPVLVRDVVMMGRYGKMSFLRIPSANDKCKVEEALARVGLNELAERQIGELSGGQKKRVFLARALAQDARVILLDEPFTGVDVETERRIIALLSAMRDEGRAMLVSTHDLGAVPEYCDRVVMVKGTVLASGPTETTFIPQNLRRAFGGTLRHFVLAGSDLHDDPDAPGLDVFTDDERPLILYDDRHQSVGRL